MNADERQALREKHRKSIEYPGKCHICSFRYQNRRVDYPCDVIKVLDAYESLIEYHNHYGNTDRKDRWCRTCWKPYPCEKGKALGHPDGAEV